MSEILLHNTLSGSAEVFKPLEKDTVRMYHCGPTVYNYPHIGNLRSFVLADTLRRMFELNGYSVTQVINITDVGHLTATNDEGFGDDGEDKVEKMARKEGKTALDIAEYFTRAFLDDISDMNILTNGTLFPKASEHIPQQIRLIQRLEKSGHTYKTSDGIYFDTATYSEYGKLGHIHLEGLRDGARIGTHDEKRNHTDFALWKFSKDGEKRFQEWDSPWGVGFPGWHIECSAMSAEYLGETFDIHTGGIDHIPVHHNNEIAQSECATGKPLAHYWIHNAFVNTDGKMSKSKGDFLRLKSLKEKGISPIEYRYWLLQARYSTQVQYSDESVQSAAQGYRNLVRHISTILKKVSTETRLSPDKILSSLPDIHSSSSKSPLISHIHSDLDTPKVIAELWSILKDTSTSDEYKLEEARVAEYILGLQIFDDAKKHIASESDTTQPIPEHIQSILDARKSAREEKNWSLSDSLREEIESFGYTISDSGTEQIVNKK